MSGGAWRLPPAAEDRSTYFAHAVALAARYGPGPWPDGGYPLPDEDPAGRRPLMSGAVLDGVRTHHFRGERDDAAAAALAGLLAEVAAGPPDLGAAQRVHDAAASSGTLAIADPLCRELGGRALPPGRLREIARWLAGYGTRRGAVAVGLVLLGLAGDARDRDLVLLLGNLEDLSLYAAVALLRSQPDRDRALFELARRVDGWGRIHAVERLARTSDPEIRDWLLRRGFRNQIMNEYLAHLAATTGGLDDALAGPAVDDELLDSAGDLLTALCLGGPAEDIGDYPAAPVVIDRYLTLVARRPPSVGRVAAVLALTRFLASADAPDLDWGSDTARGRLLDAGRALTARPDWLAAVDRGLDDPDVGRFQEAIGPATQLGIPLRDRVRARVVADPGQLHLWQVLAEESDDIDDVLALAVDLLPLDELANGPTPDLDIGVDQHILRILVGRLAGHPGHGWPLVRAALASPGTGARGDALRALAAWPAGALTGEVVGAVGTAARREPDPALQDRMRGLLETWTPAR